MSNQLSFEAVGSKRVIGEDNGVSAPEHAKVSIPIPESSRKDKPEEFQISCRLEPNNLEEESYRDALYVASVETRMARDKREAQSMLESHQLLATRNYKIMVSLWTKDVSNPSSAILDTGAGPNFVKE